MITRIKFWFYIARAMWRVSLGKWFVLRDAPTDVVEQIAALIHHIDSKDSNEVRVLVAQAQEELSLRNRRRSS